MAQEFTPLEIKLQRDILVLKHENDLLREEILRLYSRLDRLSSENEYLTFGDDL